MTLINVIRYLAPAADFGYRGEPTNEAEYKEALMWHEPGDPPTWSDIQSAWDTAHAELALSDLRVERNARLAASDWTQIPGACKTAAAWESYRQALRDLPATITDPTQPIEWPEPPK
jgi:hypothetical protein